MNKTLAHEAPSLLLLLSMRTARQMEPKWSLVPYFFFHTQLDESFFAAPRGKCCTAKA